MPCADGVLGDSFGLWQPETERRTGKKKVSDAPVAPTKAGLNTPPLRDSEHCEVSVVPRLKTQQGPTLLPEAISGW